MSVISEALPKVLDRIDADLDKSLERLFAFLRLQSVSTDPAEPKVFTLRVSMNEDGQQATLALVAPDDIVDRQIALPLPTESRLATMSAFAAALPGFLNAAHATGDWKILLGTEDPKAYDTFIGTTLEYGTLDSQTLLGGIRSLQRMRLENQGFHHGFTSESTKRGVLQRFSDMFNPPDSKWRKQIIDTTIEAVPVLVGRFQAL